MFLVILSSCLSDLIYYLDIFGKVIDFTEPPGGRQLILWSEEEGQLAYIKVNYTMMVIHNVLHNTSLHDYKNETVKPEARDTQFQYCIFYK